MSVGRRSLMVFVLLLFRIAVQSQPVQLWLDTAAGCTGDTINIHLNTSDFLLVGSLTLYITYNANELQYDTALHLHPSLPGLLVNSLNMGQPAVAFAWFTGNLNPVNIGTGTLATLRFIKLADSAQLSFSSQCEITDPMGQPLSVQYTHGMATLRSIVIFQQPNDVTVTPGSPAQFAVGVTDPGVTYRWQSSTDAVLWVDLDDDANHGGVFTDSMSLFQVHKTLHNNRYRCRLSMGNCIGYSESAILQIDTSQSIVPRNNITHQLLPYPNPFTGTILIPWVGLPVKTCTFVLRDMHGRIVEETQGSNIRPTDAGLEISGLMLQSGTYVIQLYFKDISNQEHHPAYLVMSK